MYQNSIKPIFDFTAAFFGLLLFMPIMILVYFLLKIANRGDAFFFQNRPGKNGKIFRIIKFKTMNDAKDSNGKLLSDAERLTKIGSFIRKTSLDLKGEMSLIGPRPLLTNYMHLYDDFQNRRHEVKPGITGWAQVNGRNAISWPEKFELDVWYVDHVNFIFDLKIIYLTVKKVFKSEGINSTDSGTTEPFEGN